MLKWFSSVCVSCRIGRFCNLVCSSRVSSFVLVSVCGLCVSSFFWGCVLGGRLCRDMGMVGVVCMV